MRSLRRDFAWFARFACLVVATACSSTAGAPFDAVHRTLAARGAGAEYESFTVEERDSGFVRGWRERTAATIELRELVFHGVFHREHPKAGGALRVDEAFLARASDPKPYAEYDVEAMVELAQHVKLRLRGVEDVRWFLHGEHDALVEVRATADATRFEFRRNLSGGPGEVPWRKLALDRDGVPTLID